MQFFKSHLTFLILLAASSVFGQEAVRYKTEVFTQIDSLKNIQYREAINVKDISEKLFLDVMMPHGDTLKKRPLIVFVHGGGFVNGDKATGFQSFFGKSFTKRGYVTSSINYRMGIGQPKSNETYFQAMYRAVQDAKSAIRFLRKNAPEYGIDTNRVYVCGGSAGSMTVLQLAYMEQNEVPKSINIEKLGLLETNDNAVYSSKVNAVVDCWGSMWDYHWINPGDVPLYSVHGTGDSTVPYDSSFSYHGFTYGSKILHERALAVEIPSGLRLFEKAGHNIGKENLAIALEEVSDFLYAQVQSGKKKKSNGKVGAGLAPALHTANASNERYVGNVFEKIDTIQDILFGEAINLKNENEKLLLDIYSPHGDYLKKRPLVIFVHGGGFKNGEKGKGYPPFFCEGLTKKGFVSSSISYRLGVAEPQTDTTTFEAMYRAVQDTKAAIRFFRKNAEKYGIDTDNIFVMGGSAGGQAVLNLAYLDQNEVPAYINTVQLGSLEGNSGNSGYSSAIKGVVSCWGALSDYKFMKKGDVPLFCIHGKNDKAVPFDSSFSSHGFRYGSQILYNYAMSLGIPAGIKLFENTGHTLDSDKAKQTEGLDLAAAFLAKIMGNGGDLRVESGEKPHNSSLSTLNSPLSTVVLRSDVLAKNFNAIKMGGSEKTTALKSFLAQADKILKAGKLYSVMDKKQMPPSGNKHDYMSQGPYWWPDPTKKDGLPYIRRDGERNPEYNNFSDTKEIDYMMDDALHLALAYYFTKDERYTQHAARLLKTWFLDTATLQNPNLNFSQAIPGINNGRGIGIIETRMLYKVIDAATLLQGSKNWTNDNNKALKNWFSEFLNWLIKSPNGIDEADELNNHGTHYDEQIIAYALFTEQTDLAKKQLDVTKSRIQSQFEPDGKQPRELARTVSWGYSNMNLYGFFNIARMAENVNVDLWHYETSDGKSIRKCLDYLVPFLKNEKKWSTQQIKPISYEITVELLKTAAKVYNESSYDALAKKIDAEKYNSSVYSLTF